MIDFPSGEFWPYGPPGFGPEKEKKMCDPPYASRIQDPAGQLASLCRKYSVAVSEPAIAKLIDNDWEELRRLAHAIRADGLARFEKRKARAEADGYSLY
jgi:hypothetical protein